MFSAEKRLPTGGWERENMQNTTPSLTVSKRTAQFGVFVIFTLIATCLFVLIRA